MALGAGGAGSVATDVIWDAAGDTIYGTGANTAIRLAAGTGLQYYRMNAGATAPEWATLSIALASQVTGDLPFANLTQCATNTVASNITAGTADLTCTTYADLLADMGVIASAAAPSEDRLAFYDFSALQIDYLLPGTGVQTALGAAINGAGGFLTTDGTATMSGKTVTTLDVNSTDATLSRLSAGVLGIEGIAVLTESNATTLTNKTLDPEATGNVIGFVSKIQISPVVCQGATATGGLNTMAALAPTATCVTGTNVTRGVATFPDSDGEFGYQFEIALPADFTGTVDISPK